MATSRTAALAAIAGLVLAVSAAAQTTGKTVRRHPAPAQETAVAPAVLEAEVAIEKQDFPAAERKLNQALAADPKDHRAWYDLGFVLNITGRKTEAIEAYRKAVAAKPDVFESNLNLGLTLAAEGSDEAEQYLRAATGLKPSGKREDALARAWLSLGRVLERKNPRDALAAYQEAAKLQPKDAEPHLSAAILLEKENHLPEAEAEFQQAAALDPKSPEAIAGLVNIYTRSKRLPEAEATLRKLLVVQPNNGTAHLQLGRVLMTQAQAAEAQKEFEAALSIDPDDAAARRELAAAYGAAGRHDQAAAAYRELLQKAPHDAELHHGFGAALLRARNFPDAQQALLTAVRLKPDLAEAYGDLAFAAAENKDHPLVIRALDARARFLPENPGTYFLRATSYDHLRAYKEAAENYRQFLTAAAGKYPDQEWKARHRLNAIVPSK